jgi:hypothetical protein
MSRSPFFLPELAAALAEFHPKAMQRTGASVPAESIRPDTVMVGGATHLPQCLGWDDQAFWQFQLQLESRWGVDFKEGQWCADSATVEVLMQTVQRLSVVAEVVTFHPTGTKTGAKLDPAAVTLETKLFGESAADCLGWDVGTSVQFMALLEERFEVTLDDCDNGKIEAATVQTLIALLAEALED